MVKLRDATVVITGGSQGIGEQLAECFAAEGSKVLLVARSEDKLRAVAGRIGGDWLVADLGVAADVDALVPRCIERLGHIDVWVNNAGLETSDAFVHLDPEQIRALARVNFEAPLMLTRAVLGHMVARGTGHVVQMSSVVHAAPFPAMAAYAGSKAGLTNFTETLRLEFRGMRGIGFTMAAPGPVTTEMWDRVDDGQSWGTPALRRFGHLFFLPKIDTRRFARSVVRAVRRGKGLVRPKARYLVMHMPNNLPRRIVQAALIGVRMPEMHGDAPDGHGDVPREPSQ